MAACACWVCPSSPTSVCPTHWNRRACHAFSRWRAPPSRTCARSSPASSRGSDSRYRRQATRPASPDFTHVASPLAPMTAPQDTGLYTLLPDGGADALEQELLARWESERLFETVQEARAGAPPY